MNCLAKRDYYEVLGVDKTATDDDIKKAYRRKAKECHPDLHPDDKEAEEKFKELNEANEVLSNPEKRRRYDQFGFEGPGASGFGGASGFSGFGDMGDMGDLFSSIFGGMGGMRGGSRRNGPVPGNDLQYRLTITFEEAFFGCSKSIDFVRDEICDHCSGSGAKAGTQPQTCPTCRGSGQVQSGGGFFVMNTTCPTCRGEGKIIKDKCTHCKGTGKVSKKRTITMNIPAGIENGMKMKQRGEGEPGMRGGQPGDLYVVVSVKSHKLFQRDGSTVLLSMPITMTQAALGAEITVPTMNGADKLKIPEGTQNGTEFRLKGKGFKSLRNGIQGDMVITVNVEIPKGLGERQKEYLRQLENSSNGREYKERRAFEASSKEWIR